MIVEDELEPMRRAITEWRQGTGMRIKYNSIVEEHFPYLSKETEEEPYVFTYDKEGIRQDELYKLLGIEERHNS